MTETESQGLTLVYKRFKETPVATRRDLLDSLPNWCVVWSGTILKWSVSHSLVEIFEAEERESEIM